MNEEDGRPDWNEFWPKPPALNGLPIKDNFLGDRILIGFVVPCFFLSSFFFGDFFLGYVFRCAHKKSFWPAGQKLFVFRELRQTSFVCQAISCKDHPRLFGLPYQSCWQPW